MAPGLEAENRADCPTAHYFVQHPVVVQELLSPSEGQVVASVDVDGMADIEQRWPVRQPHITQGEGIRLALPVVWRRDTKRVTPGVIGVKLHSMPRALAEIHL